MQPLPDEWKEEFARLRSERDLAFRELVSLRGSVDNLAEMVATQNDRLDQVLSMLRRREEQVRRLETENRKLRKQLGLDDPEPEPDAAPVPEDATPAGESTESETGSTPSSGSKASVEGADDDKGPQKPAPKRAPRPRSRGGRRPPPDHLPADTERHDVCACGKCGGRVLKRDLLTKTVFTVVPTYLRRRVILRERVICADCGEPTTAPMPPMPCERALYDCGFLAWLVVMKFALLVPLDRIRTLLLSQGVDIAMGTLVHLIERAADLAGPIDGEHLKQLKAGTYMHFDGTGLKALVLGQSKAWKAYLEVFTRDEITVFQFDMTKHADRLRERMNGFLGIRQWLDGVRASSLPPSDPVRKLAEYYVKHFDDLTRFVDDGNLPIDNNAAEREFQRHAKLRHASLFAGSPEGGHRWATLFGVVRTAQKCEVDMLAYLTWMFERRGTHRKQFGMTAAELTPMAYRDLVNAAQLAA